MCLTLLEHMRCPPTREAVAMRIIVLESGHDQNVTVSTLCGQRRRRACRQYRRGGPDLHSEALVNKITCVAGPCGTYSRSSFSEAPRNAVLRYCAPRERGGPRRL